MVEIISIEPEQGKEFDELINEKGNVSFVKFHQPTCPHCTEMKKAWEDLGKLLQDKCKDDISLIEVNGDALSESKSDVSKEIRGFPTIMILKSGKKKAEYSGDRSTEDMLKFMIDNKIIFPISGGYKKGGKKSRTMKSKTKKNNSKKGKSRKNKYKKNKFKKGKSRKNKSRKNKRRNK
jgi:thiol-disulfide isomerase/thioredoxin